MGAQRLIDMGFTGYRGWGDTEAEADFKNTGGSGKKPQSGGGGGGGGGSNSGGGINVDDLIRRQREEAQALIDKQNRERDARFAEQKNDLSAFIGEYKGVVPQTINAANEKYGVGDLLNFTNALNTRIKTLRGNTDNSGAGGFASANQVDRAINTRFLPNYLTASENLQRGAQLAQTEVDTILQPYKVEASLLNDRLAREMTGYTASQQRELDSLLSILNTQGNLTSDQAKLAQELSLAEKDYELRKTELEQSAQANRYMGAGSGYLYDTTTGKFIQVPKTTGGSITNLSNTTGSSSGKPTGAPSANPFS